MRVQSYIHQFDLNPPTTTLFGDVTLASGAVTLKQIQPAAIFTGRGWGYPTTGVSYVRSDSFGPDLRTRWGFIELVGDTPEEYADSDDTSFSVRAYLDDGSSYWWGGAAWVVAGAGDFNSLADFNANLSTLQDALALTDTLAIEIRLQTSNPDLTPAIKAVKLQWKGKVADPFDEWVYGGVVASMAEAIRPLTDYVVPSDGTDEVNLDDYPLEAAWDVTNVIAAFNNDTDPNHTNDLFMSYAAPTVTLSAAQVLDENIWLVMEYAPQIAVTTDSDFTEQAKAPAILITSVNIPTPLVRSLGATGPSVIDVTASPPSGTVFPNPVPLMNIDFTLATVAPTSLDLHKLNGAVTAWLRSHPLLHSPAYDQSVRLDPGFELAWATGVSNVGDPRQSSGVFGLRDIPWYTDALLANADGKATAAIGPVDAGDPNYPGEGYGVEKLTMEMRDLAGSGHDTTETT